MVNEKNNKKTPDLLESKGPGEMNKLICKIVLFPFIVFFSYHLSYGVTAWVEAGPRMAFDPMNNQYLVSYWVFDYVSIMNTVYGRLMNVDGTRKGNLFRISEGYDFARRPAVSYGESHHTMLVVWDENTNIYGQFVNADGTLKGENFVISDSNELQSNASIKYNNFSQYFLVVWEDYRNNAITGYDIHGQLINDSGTLIGSDLIISDATKQQDDPVITYGKSSHIFFIVWTDARNDGITGTDIYGQFVNADGTLNGDNFIVCDALGDQNQPAIVYNDSDQTFLVVWLDNRNEAARGSDIYGQIVEDGGVLNGENIIINTSDSDKEALSIDYDAFNKVLFLVWTQKDDSDHSLIFGQFLNNDGSQKGKSFAVTYNHSLMPFVASNPHSGNFLVAYSGSNEWSPNISTISYEFIKVPDNNSGDKHDSGCFVTACRKPKCWLDFLICSIHSKE